MWLCCVAVRLRGCATVWLRVRAATRGEGFQLIIFLDLPNYALDAVHYVLYFAQLRGCQKMESWFAITYSSRPPATLSDSALEPCTCKPRRLW